MALFQSKMFSYELYRSINVNVCLPLPDSTNDFFNREIKYPQAGEKFQVLYLLHGFSADECDWQRFSRIEYYAQEKNIAVVMPDAYNSSYENTPWGANYYNYVAYELPKMVESVFPISEKRENKFIAGLSMGGRGALRIALTNLDKYAAVASLSGGLYTGAGDGWDYSVTNRPKGVRSGDFNRAIFGGDSPLPNADKTDIKRILKAAVDSGEELPKIYQCCGTEDFLYEVNCEFRDYAKSIGVDLTYEEGPGVHNYDFWDPYIRKILNWLPITGDYVK